MRTPTAGKNWRRGLTNPNAYEKVVQYTEAVHKRHGEAYDLATEPLDTDVLMRTVGGKQHGWYFLAHSVIDSITVPTLREVRRSDSTTSSDVPIQPRWPSSTQMMAAVQATICRSLVLHM
jgi:phage terminase large subunit-like protein